MSEKRILGWEPTETHRHVYDEAGRLVRTTVTRESEWDDMERAKMLALADYEANLCDCGFPCEVADTDPDLTIKYRECPVCSGLAKAARVQAARDRALVAEVYGKDGPQPGDELPDDGRRIVGLEAAES